MSATMPPPSEQTVSTTTTTKASPNSKLAKMHRRSRSGCFTCRLRRKKCDEGKNKCKACRHLGLDCEYKRPQWWGNNDLRRKQKELIKSIIKRTKTNEKAISQASSRMTPPGLSHSVPTSDSYSDALSRPHNDGSDDSDDFDDYNNIDPTFVGTPGYYDPHGQQLYATPYAHPHMYGHGYSYEVDVKTERQMYVNDIPTRRDSSISTFSTFVPPPPHAMLPSYTGEEFVQQDFFESQHDDWTGEEGLDFNFFDFSHGHQPPNQAQTAMIPVDDCDKGLLDHLIQNVLPLVFPILEANQHGSVKADVILPSLETNKAYLHSCLSAAAIHLKSTCTDHSENIDGDILRHKFAFVTEVVTALGSDTNHLEILEATLGMISLQCVTGRADETEKDIPWHQHFQAAAELVQKLNLPAIVEELPTQNHGVHPPFNMTLTAWIDILGSTMLGRAPTFANTYRTKHLSAASTGLAELMGCQDNVMYLLSEVACLDALRQDKILDDVGVCSHITSLAQQLDATESPTDIVQSPYSSSGAIRPRQLSKNITAIFRKAVRVYLCSLVPSYDRYGQAIVNLISQITEMLQYIPSGPDGFDRSLVWPLLIGGANSIPTSPLRRVLVERAELLGIEAEQGSFGRMMKVLRETWRRNDEIALSAGLCEITPVTASSPAGSLTTPLVPTLSITPQPSMAPLPLVASPIVHWRDVMHENGWDFLLI